MGNVVYLPRRENDGKIRKHPAKIYRFPDLASVYHWLNEVRGWDAEREALAENIAESFDGDEMDVIHANAQIREWTQQIESNLLLIAHELFPEEVENVGELQDFMLGLLFENMTNEDIVHSVLDTRREMLTEGIVQ